MTNLGLTLVGSSNLAVLEQEELEEEDEEEDKEVVLVLAVLVVLTRWVPPSLCGEMWRLGRGCRCKVSAMELEKRRGAFCTRSSIALV